jgi:glycosyltransferase involved in cell wall biosynthesis
LSISKITGLSGYFVNQNIHVCEHNFNPDLGVKKIYDAVYIAAAKKYKRLHLAKKIKKLFIITYFWPDIRNEKGEWDLHAFEPSIKHADFNTDRIDRNEINHILNMAYCGLALSKKEGAMLASMEYQLAGLPVVTTHSIGGRDILLDPAHTIWVKSDPEKIAAAVEKFVKSPPDPVEIRNRTLANLDFHRKRFYNVIGGIYAKNSKTIEPYDAFRKRIWGAANGLEAHSILQ